MTVFSKLEGSAMDTNFYITARSSKFPLDYAHSREDAAALLARHRDRHPDAVVESTNAYFERTRAETLASFPLSRITQRRSEEHTSELQSLMRISYAVFCLKTKKYTHTQNIQNINKK